MLIFLSGHGKTVSSGFYFLPFDFDVAKFFGGSTSSALSSDEILQILNKSRATRQVLILDACEAGGGGDLGHVRPLSGRSFHFLAAAQATQRAMEISELGHGLLTYVLLQRLHESFGTNRTETVGSLLDWSQKKVTRLSAMYDSTRPQSPRYWHTGSDFVLTGMK